MDDYSIGEDLMGEDLMGEDDYSIGEEDDVVGAITRSGAVRRIRIPAPGRGMNVMRVPAKPNWRRGAVAPGVWGPRENRELLPITPEQNGGQFTSAVPFIRFRARPQRPFLPRRLITTIFRSAGAGAATVEGVGIIIGTQVNLVEISNFDLSIFAGNNFGVGLKLIPCGPGIDVQIPAQLAGAALPPGESITVSMAFIGSSIT